MPIKHPTDFSNRFYLLGEHTQVIQQFFTDKITHFFDSNPYYHIQSNGEDLLVFGQERLASIKQIKALYDFDKRLKAVIS